MPKTKKVRRVSQGADVVKRRELRVVLTHVEMECMEVVRRIQRGLSSMESSLVKVEVKQEVEDTIKHEPEESAFSCGSLSDWVKPLESVRPCLGSSDQTQLQHDWESIQTDYMETEWDNNDADSVLTEPYIDVRDEDCQTEPQPLKVIGDSQTEPQPQRVNRASQAGSHPRKIDRDSQTENLSEGDVFSEIKRKLLSNIESPDRKELISRQIQGNLWSLTELLVWFKRSLNLVYGGNVVGVSRELTTIGDDVCLKRARVEMELNRLMLQTYLLHKEVRLLRRL